MAGIRETTDQTWDADVLQSDLAVLADFWAEWCGPCKMMEPLLEELAAAHQESLTVVKVDVQQYPDIATSYGVMNLPTMILFKDGEIKERITGYMPIKVLQRKIEDYI